MSDSLVLGVTGSFGGAVARELVERGRGVRALVRDGGRARAKLGDFAERVELVEGDVQDRDGLVAAASGCGVIVHGVNYPYDQWVPNMENATRNVVAAAREAGAAVVFPGNVYGLAPHYDEPLDESHPEDAPSRKGALRVELEALLAALAEEEGTRVLVVRANDYFGPTVRNGLVDPIFGNAAAGKAMNVIGDPDVRHEMVYVPDLARATVDLLGLGGRPDFEVVHVGGYVEPTFRDFLLRVARIAGSPPKVRAAPRFVLRILGLWNGVVRELGEMMYLFENSLLLSDRKLRTLLPDFRYTPIDDAIATTVESYRADAAGGA
jgi:nucleoside-diphosphate-sugar epimerase